MVIRAGFACAVCLAMPIAAGCSSPSQIANAVKEQVQKEMADVQEKTQRQVEAVKEKADEAVALAQERAEEIRADAKEQIEQIQQKADERIRELEAKLKEVSEGVVNEGQVISDLHEDDRMQKYP